MLKIIDANEEYLDGYKESFLLTMKEIELGNIKKHDMMFLNPDEINIIEHFKNNRDESKLQFGYVPSFDYFAVDDDKFIGIIHIRVRLTPSLLKFGGILVME